MNFITKFWGLLDGPGQNPRRERLVYFGAILILFILFTSKQCHNTGLKKKIAECDKPGFELIDTTILNQIKKAAESKSIITEQNPRPTDTIVKEKIVYKNHTTFVKTWNDLQDFKERYLNLSEEHAELLYRAQQTRDSFIQVLEENDGVIVFETSEPTQTPPILETVKRDTGANYDIKTTIWSYGPLESFSQEVVIQPEVVTLSTTEYKTLKAKNFVALKAGALFLDRFQNVYYTPSLEYGRKWWSLEAGPVMDRDFNIRGLEGKAGIVVKF